MMQAIKTCSLPVLVLTLCAGLLAQSQPAASPDVLIRQALQRDQVDGDPVGAIGLLKSLVARHPNDPLVPRALLQMAGIYERLGRPEARETYQTLLLKYADVADVAATARDRLAALTRRAGGPTETEYPVPPEAVDLGGAVSPDGRFISFVDDTFVAQEAGNGVGNLGIWDLNTGLTRLVTRSPGWEEGHVRESIWSPDGQTLAYRWFNRQSNNYEIRTVAINGGAPRTVYIDEGQEPGVVPFSWSPDGATLAVVRLWGPPTARRGGRTHHELATLTIAHGEIRVLKAFDGPQVPRRALFSPDGGCLIYDWPSSEASTSRDIFTLSIADSSEVPLVVDPASDDIILGWAPDGRHLIYAADHAATRESRAIAIVDGRPSLEPIVIKRGIGDDVTGLGVTRDGRLFVRRAVGGEDVLTVPLNSVTGLASGPPATLPPSQPGVFRAHPSWSPDGTRLAYLQSGSNTDYTLVVQDIGNGNKTFYALRLGGGPERIAWQPDQRAVVLRGVGDNGNGQYRVDLSTGAVTFFTRGHTAAFSPDGRSAFFPAPPAHPTGGGIVRRDLTDGSEVSVDKGRHRSMALSPDGKLLALFDPGADESDSPSIAVAPSGGGERRTIVRGFREMDGELDFSADSQFVYFTTILPFEIWRVSVNGGQPEHVASVDRWIKHLSARKDGQAFAISTGGSWVQVAAWEHLLPDRPGK